MGTESLAAVLEREHQEIDAGIAAFTAAPDDPQPLKHAIQALRRHIYLEEEYLFPLLGEADPALRAPVFVMLREHAQIWGLLDALHGEPDGSAGPALCRQLASYLLHHNMKEERVLYPRADAVLPPAAAGRLRTFLDAGELPAGWVCVQARPAAQAAARGAELGQRTAGPAPGGPTSYHFLRVFATIYQFLPVLRPLCPGMRDRN